MKIREEVKMRKLMKNRPKNCKQSDLQQTFSPVNKWKSNRSSAAISSLGFGMFDFVHFSSIFCFLVFTFSQIKLAIFKRFDTDILQVKKQ